MGSRPNTIIKSVFVQFLVRLHLLKSDFHIKTYDWGNSCVHFAFDALDDMQPSHLCVLCAFTSVHVDNDSYKYNNTCDYRVGKAVIVS